MVTYTYDQQLVEITEVKGEADITFRVTIKSDEMRTRLKALRAHLDHDKDFTDALFYTHLDGTYEVIVRNDFYLPFLLQAFRLRCIESLSWK
ncbi:hypothetical protein [Brevibacillus migulae]|uniref:hypothetical protein n=1 Tax=Brevibacillus migulae TaxID=1644114 RepID=UPI00106E9898|nr:hypothetical protein [Brevibacillus migulae]